MSLLRHLQDAIGSLQEALAEVRDPQLGEELLTLSHQLQELEARVGEDADESDT